jgi:hypothetical protein
MYVLKNGTCRWFHVGKNKPNTSNLVASVNDLLESHMVKVCYESNNLGITQHIDRHSSDVDGPDMLMPTPKIWSRWMIL